MSDGSDNSRTTTKAGKLGSLDLSFAQGSEFKIITDGRLNDLLIPTVKLLGISGVHKSDIYADTKRASEENIGAERRRNEHRSYGGKDYDHVHRQFSQRTCRTLVQKQRNEAQNAFKTSQPCRIRHELEALPRLTNNSPAEGTKGNERQSLVKKK